MPEQTSQYIPQLMPQDQYVIYIQDFDFIPVCIMHAVKLNVIEISTIFLISG